MDWNSVLAAFGAISVWALGAYGSYLALTEVGMDEAIAIGFAALWPIGWPLIGAFAYFLGYNGDVE